MIRSVRRFAALDRRRRRALCEAFAFVLFNTIAVRIVRFPTLRRALASAPFGRQAVASAFASVEIDRIRWAVAAASRRIPGSTCLVSAVAADVMLRRRGLPSVLRLGVSPVRGADGTLDAHAWVESSGSIVAGESASLDAYTELQPAARIEDALCAVVRGDDASWRSLGATAADVANACSRYEFTGVILDTLGQTIWPADVLDLLQTDCRAAAAVEAVRGRELTLVLHALTKEGIKPVLFKGAALAYGAYHSPASRPRCDVDLFLRAEDIAAAGRIMRHLGYAPPPYCDGQILFRQVEWARRDQYGIDHAFDLHWNLSTQVAFADVLTYEEVVSESVSVPALGPNATAAGPVHALLIACIHPAMHHRNEARLIWIYDIHLLASSLTASDFDRFAALVVRTRMAAVSAHHLRLAHDRFGTVIPDGVLSALAAAVSPEPSAEYLTAGRRWHHEMLASLRSLDGWRDRIRLTREVLLPSGGYMLAAYGLPRQGGYAAILPALYIHRALHGAWKVLTGRK